MAVGLSLDTAALRGAVAAMKAADRQLQRDIRQRTKTVEPVWKQAVARRARTDQDRALVRVGTRLAPGNPPTLQAATSKRRMSRRRKGRGTLVPADDHPLIEFGSTRSTRVPPRTPNGRIVYQAVADVAPLVAARWAQAIRDAYLDRAQTGAVPDGR